MARTVIEQMFDEACKMINDVLPKNCEIDDSEYGEDFFRIRIFDCTHPVGSVCPVSMFFFQWDKEESDDYNWECFEEDLDEYTWEIEYEWED